MWQISRHRAGRRIACGNGKHHQDAPKLVTFEPQARCPVGVRLDTPEDDVLDLDLSTDSHSQQPHASQGEEVAKISQDLYC